MVEHDGGLGSFRRLARQRFVAFASLALCVGITVPVRARAQAPSEAKLTPIPLEVGKLVARTATQKGPVSFAILLSAGDYVSILARAHGYAVSCVLRDPNGSEAITSWEVTPEQT